VRLLLKQIILDTEGALSSFQPLKFLLYTVWGPRQRLEYPGGGRDWHPDEKWHFKNVNYWRGREVISQTTILSLDEHKKWAVK